MAFTEKVCSICSRLGGRKVIDAMLEKNIPMKQIAAETGFSKSSIGRHSLKCLAREAASKIKSGQFDRHSQRIIQISADGFTLVYDPLNPRATAAEALADWQENPRPDDVIVQAVCAPAVAPRLLKTNIEPGTEVSNHS